MLTLGGISFTRGRSTFLDFQKEYPERTAKIYVPLVLEDLDAIIYAQLDTGAAWSILDPSVARLLGLLEHGGIETSLETRFGKMKGRLVRIPLRFLANDGEHFETEGTFFVSPEWPTGHTFLGYSGLLDSIRFALDPQVNHFYFGPGI